MQVDAVGRLGLAQDLQHALGVRGVRDDEVPLVAEAVDDQVLDHPAALVEDQVVLRLADRDARDVVRDDPLEQPERARARRPRPCRGGSGRTARPARGRRGARRARPSYSIGISQPPNGPSFAPARDVLGLERRVLDVGRRVHRAHRTPRSRAPGSGTGGRLPSRMGDAYDVAVIGAGTGGYSAAFRAAQLGLRVALDRARRATRRHLPAARAASPRRRCCSRPR